MTNKFCHLSENYFSPNCDPDHKRMIFLVTYLQSKLVNYDLFMLFETENLLAVLINWALPCFFPTTHNRTFWPQPILPKDVSAQTENKMLPTHIYFFKKVPENIKDFFYFA